MKIFRLPVVIFSLSFFLFNFASGVFAASLSLSPATATKNVGDTFTVDIVLDTLGEAVSGATAIINYDKVKLAVVDGDSSTAGVNIKPSGQYLTQVLTNSVDATKGQIRYDAGNLGSSYTGRGIIGTITFEAVSTGLASASFAYNSTSTTNTSAVAAASGPTNLLETITDGSYTVNGGGTGGSSSGDDTLVESGAFEDTVLLLLGGLLFLGAGSFLARYAFYVR